MWTLNAPAILRKLKTQPPKTLSAMNTQPQTCDPSLIERYLADSLDASSEARFHSHLENCEVCRDRVEHAAADASSWSDAEEFLRDQPFDEGSFSTSSFGAHNEQAHDDVKDRKASMSVEIAQVLGLLNPTDDPQMLGRLGGYDVSGVIGSGGMGIVLKAFDGPLDRTVAIKVLAPRLASSGAARRRFAREAKAAATVLHPNVIVIHGVSNDGALPFLVMPYLRGESLQRRLDRQGPLQTEEILRIGQQVASGLAAAHGQGLVHRDIKPANILLEDGVERVTLTDFGLARAVDDASMTRSGVIAGTPQYMSPEQARGDNVDARSDLFSLGSVMYAMCTGRPPFRAETSFGILRRITDTDPRPIREVNPNIPEWLVRIVARLLAKSLDDRIQTADHIAKLFEQCLAHVQQPTIVELPYECRPIVRASKFLSQSWRGRAALIVIGCLAVPVMYSVNRLMRDRQELNPVSESEPSSNFDESITAWDEVQTEIEEFENDLQPAEAETEKLWGTN